MKYADAREGNLHRVSNFVLLPFCRLWIPISIVPVYARLIMMCAAINPIATGKSSCIHQTNTNNLVDKAFHNGIENPMNNRLILVMVFSWILLCPLLIFVTVINSFQIIVVLIKSQNNRSPYLLLVGPMNDTLAWNDLTFHAVSGWCIFNFLYLRNK